MYLCFEGTSISSDVRTLLASSAVPTRLTILLGTIWPKPTVIHVLASGQFLHELTALARSHAEAEICDHFHAYDESHGLMQWYDAFDLPLLIDESIGEISVLSQAGSSIRALACSFFLTATSRCEQGFSSSKRRMSRVQFVSIPSIRSSQPVNDIGFLAQLMPNRGRCSCEAPSRFSSRPVENCRLSLWFKLRGCKRKTPTEALRLLPLKGGLLAPSAGMGA